MMIFAADSGSHLQVLIPVLLISTAVLMPIIFHWRPLWCPDIAFASISLGLLGALVLFLQVKSSPEGYFEYFLGHSWGGKRFLATGQPIGIVLRSDLIGVLMTLLVMGIGWLATLYSKKYIQHVVSPGREGYYYTLVLLLLAGLVGICLTGDCFNFYVFLEVASISSYALVAMPQDGQALEAAFKYMLVGALGSILIVFGIALLFASTGTLNMAYAAKQIGEILQAPMDSPLNNFRYLVFGSLGLFVIGFSVKSAFIPTHAWLADAHPVAPSSISALLSGLVVKATGILLLIRFLFQIFGIHKNPYGDLLSPIFMALAAATTIGGSLFAIAQNNLKRMLAYSTVAQMGYILIGIALLSRAGLEGSVLHMVNHALIKALLFLCAGAVIYQSGIKDIRQMSRIGYKTPLVMGCFSVGALSMVGVPPLNGFMSKWALAEAALEAKLPFLVVVLLFSSLLNAVYYFRVVGVSFFSSTAYDNTIVMEKLPWEMKVPLLLLAGSLVAAGIKVGVLKDVIRPAVGILLK